MAHSTRRHVTDRLPSQIPYLTREERAWIGAMIQGEGCIVRARQRLGWHDWTVKVGNTDIEVIATLLRLTNGGWIRVHRRDLTSSYKPYWEWGISRANSIIDLLRAVIPYLTNKRELAQEAIKDLEAPCGAPQ